MVARRAINRKQFILRPNLLKTSFLLDYGLCVYKNSTKIYTNYCNWQLAMLLA